METLRKTGALAEAQLRGTRGKGRPPKDPVVPTRVPVPPTGDAWVPTGTPMPADPNAYVGAPGIPVHSELSRLPRQASGGESDPGLLDELPKRPPRGPHSPQHKRNQEVLERLNGSQQGPEAGGGAQLGSL